MEEKLRQFYSDRSTRELKNLLEDKLRRVSPTMEHVRNLILDVKMLFRILSDEEFELGEEAKRDFVSAILYFVENKDKINDRIPLIGYWDDYKLVRYVKKKHSKEIERYFSETRHFIANYF